MKVCSVYDNFFPSFTGNHIKDLQHFMDSPIRKVLKQECIDAVSTKKQYEKAILVDTKKNKVISLSNGTLTDAKVSIPKHIIFDKNYSLIHSHPTLIDKNGDKYSLPVSFGDFELLVNNKELKEIVAINAEGEETILQKKDSFEKISKDKMQDLRMNYFKTLYDNLCNEEEKHQIDILYEYTKTHPNSPAIKQNIINKILDKQYNSEASNVIKSFFYKIAERLNLNFIENNK